MIVNLEDITIKIYLIKTLFLIFCTYFTFLKIINDKKYFCKEKIIGFIYLILLALVVTIIKSKTNSFLRIMFMTFMLSCVGLVTTKNNFGYSIAITIISLAFNYSVFIIATVLAFLLNNIITIQSDFMNLILMAICHVIILTNIFRTRKLKYGISFLQIKGNNESVDVTILNISMSVLFISILFSNRDLLTVRTLLPYFIMLAMTTVITIQKSLQLYYKQKLLAQELENTKKELADKTKEIQELEAENISISKKAHTLDHKQKSLAKKIDEMMLNTEISKDEVAEVRNRLNKIGKELYKEKTATELPKTEITEIDDMLKYMQAECNENKIEFELQLKGNIHYMINNLITKEDLETLLADHIKNAIIAIKHTDNINRSILVRLGEIDGIYSLYIYDSGIEFQKETLENLGKKPSTTHADEGGTGIGFMNTFDTLRKCKASLTIEEFNEPSKDNYTKAIIIKFDNKNEFKIKSYRQQTEML